MFYIGSHISSAKGYEQMGKDALTIGANIFQFFLRNPRGGAAKEIDPNDVAAYLSLGKKEGFGPILAHASYTLNPCAAKEHLRVFARDTMADDLRRMEYTPGNLYNFHPGSHVGQGTETGVALIAAMLNEVLRPKMQTTVLLETMSGKGSEVGGRFEELRAIIDQVTLSDRLGICLDTCHVYDGGYNIKEDLDGVLAEFDRVIGLERLKAIHLNDTKNPYASHKDRHAKLGEGYLGVDFFEKIINHPLLRDLPFYLETPNELPGYAEEIALLKKLRKE